MTDQKQIAGQKQQKDVTLAGGTKPEDGDGKTAVALSYEIGGENLPKVVATGRGQLAEDIVRLAFDAGVKVREDADLAQLLVTLDLDTEIPTEAMEAVAEILAYVYKANGKMAEMKEAADALNAAEAAREAAGESEADPVDQGRRNLAQKVDRAARPDKPGETSA
ncbi:MAG: EscU/YscU/HrcU family type III secretion system export apparatus switch protein [Alphaproteobacteria bacterium]|nr:EscU/YscU/HrcU family type III secretion system export apparatus switch protein [Alphaproteobacteria bacterium SS10]